MTGYVEKFLAYAAHDRGWAPNTIDRYAAVLRSIPDIATWTTDDADIWWESRRTLGPASRANELAVLRSFFKWMTRWDYRPDDPTRRLEAPKLPRRLPRPISRSELHAVLKQCDTEQAVDLRRAVCLGAYGGLRVSEAASLDWSHFDHEARRIRVFGKGAKERLVPYSPVLLDELLPDTGGNVVTAGGAPYSADVLQRKVNRMIERAGVDLTFHALRKRWATLALGKTGDLLAVSSAAGWASMQTAVVYATPNQEVMDAIAAAVVE